VSNKFNVLLCFDSNYNIQGEVTMMSLLENTSSQLTFYIIHENPATLEKLIKRTSIHPNVENIYTYKFIKRDNVNFPSFDESHMSEATYYRLFIGDYLPKEIKNIIYVDPDIICINNFDTIIDQTLSVLNSTDLLLAAKTEHMELDDSETSVRLELTKNKYFNAGVTVINVEKWINQKYTDKLLEKMDHLGERVFWFDQDILNSYVDGDYLELPSALNFTDLSLSLNDIKEVAIFYHYSGKKKPWTVKGFISYGESFYQEIYREIFDNNYHIVHTYKRDSIRHFLMYLLSLKILNLNYPLTFIKNFIKSMKG
jgi:lipopolysaccharide biosynthesis glycosyltransferase